ncbi:hypothetical protein RV134_350065 [Roseovarius sp. EC-HK134]|nr:hypothetical protein RV420_400341 [Roseovarius sp. EC-SD190]VVT28009.1 hypothetical protein RV134_350065 [Roseovarius sp. EC-HK134]
MSVAFHEISYSCLRILAHMFPYVSN